MPLATYWPSPLSVPSRRDTTNGPDKRELARSRSRRRLSAHSLSVFRPLHASLFPYHQAQNKTVPLPLDSAPAAPIVTTIVLLLVIVGIVLALLEADVLLLGLLLSTSSTTTLASIIIVIVLRPLAP